MKLINLTPHALTIHGRDGVDPLTLAPSGMVARVTVRRQVWKYVDPGSEIPIYETALGELVDLPEPAPRTFYIASLVVAQAAAARGRTDVLSPGELIRNEQGQPIGCNGLSRP